MAQGGSRRQATPRDDRDTAFPGRIVESVRPIPYNGRDHRCQLNLKLRRGEEGDRPNSTRTKEHSIVGTCKRALLAVRTNILDS